MRRNSVLEELRVNRLAVIQEEISCKVVWTPTYYDHQHCTLQV